MPESKCWDCGESNWRPTIELLKEWELAHHSDSATINKRGEKLHGCRGFQEYGENGYPVGYRIYNYDMLVEEEVY